MSSLFRKMFPGHASQPKTSSPVNSLYEAATRAYQAKEWLRAVELCDQIIALQPRHAEAHYKKGNALKDVGRPEDAIACYELAIQADANFAHAWCNRGVVLQSLGLNDAAIESYVKATSLDPSDAIAHVNLGFLLQATSRWEAALASYDRALAENPQLSQVWFHRGNVLKELRREDEALLSYGEAARMNPDHVEAHYNCGVLSERVGRWHDALASYDKAVSIRPEFHQAHFNLAGVFKKLNQPDAALRAYDRAIGAKSDYAEAYANRGALLQQLGRGAESLESYECAISIRPDHAEAYFNRGTLFSEQMRPDAALTSFDQAIMRRPDFAAAHCERARVLMQLNRVDDALASYDRAVELEPEFAAAQYNRSLALLLAGDYLRGWPSYEWRWQNADKLRLIEPRQLGRPLWLGRESLAGKTLFVYGEQGYGDTLQFCRFARSVQELGATVVLEAQAPLVGLLKTLDGVTQVVARGDSLPEYDYQCPLMSLPLALKTTIAGIPAPVRYLRGDPTKIARWRERLTGPGEKRIGLAWSGNPMQGNDQNRSTRLAEWIPYLPREFHYISLQKDIRATDLATLEANPWISRFDSELHDFSDTAALCECLDLVISVCTSTAHLGGALGRPTWVVLPFAPDWRWLLTRNDSPWYPSARLFRQPAMGDWNGVLSCVAEELVRGTSSGGGHRI